MIRVVVVALVAVVALTGVARAHDLRPGVLAFVETGPGELRVRFVPPIDSRGEVIPLVLPDGCTRSGDRVHCKDGFGGQLAVGGMRGHAMKIFVSLERDGARRDWVLTSEAPRIDLGPASPATAHAWIRNGVHSFGLVHVVLVLALIFAFGVSRSLGIALVAFTLARVLAAQLAIDGPFDALVALAALLLARADKPPRAVATGLVFGIASGLALPGGAWFQVGVAVTQLAIAGIGCVLVVVANRSIGERRVVGVRAHGAARYALGALAAWLLIARLAGG